MPLVFFRTLFAFGAIDSIEWEKESAPLPLYMRVRKPPPPKPSFGSLTIKGGHSSLLSLFVLADLIRSILCSPRWIPRVGLPLDVPYLPHHQRALLLFLLTIAHYTRRPEMVVAELDITRKKGEKPMYPVSTSGRANTCRPSWNESYRLYALHCTQHVSSDNAAHHAFSLRRR